ncbi:venom phosphodiesterase 2-like [Dysidea avara]|uniref:venom phosphodiesterase 2-like n=1 Tax=Dysidea avara TaxID=196820 RepID=UPI003325012D
MEGDSDHSNEDDEATAQDDSPYLQFLDSEKRKSYQKKSKRLMIIIVLTFVIIFVITFITAAVLIGISSTAGNNSNNDNDAISSASEQICAHPPLIHISLDGYRHDYYKRQLNPHLQYVIDTGVRAEYLRSQYPTQTFPNHYTIMTGLYPEYHGIVTNFFFDKDLNKTYQMSNEPQWWSGEPLWITAKRNGLISGVYFWPGSEVPGLQPDYYFNYNRSVPFQSRINTILSWLDLSQHKRPSFIALYFSEPDHSGHQYGPNSVEVNQSITMVDNTLGLLLDGLKERNISDCVNLIITSDHGMQFSSENTTIYLEDYLIDPTADGIQVTYLGPVVQLNVYSPADKEVLYNKLKMLPHVQVFYLNEVPYRLRIGHNFKNRYGDIVVIPDIGWFITSRSDMYNFIVVRSGEHGYDNNAVTMRAFMAARGPAFKQGYVSDSFDNTQLYNLECALLGIPPSDNNGTFGALHHLLRDDMVKELPKDQSYEPVNPEVTVQCVIPSGQELCDRINCTGCQCSSCMDSVQNIMQLTPAQIDYYQSYHTLGGVPQGGGGRGSCLLTDQHHIIKYSTTLHIPLWIAYRMNGPSEPVSGNNCWRADPRVPAAVKCSDYNSDHYVAGSLANPGLYTSSQYFTSLVSQIDSFNQNIWQVLQEQLINWSNLYSSIHVISGCILDSNHDSIRDDDNRWISRDVVPTQFYTIVISCANRSVDISECTVNDIRTIGVVLYHQTSTERKGKDYFRYRITSLREIEKIIDTNFFPDYTSQQQNQIELQITTDLWPSACNFPNSEVVLNERTKCSECICPYCEVNKTLQVESVQVYNISQFEVPIYLSQHIPWGVPQGGGSSETCLLTQPYYIINYSSYYHIPLWVAYQLDGSSFANYVRRKNCFRRDPRVAISDNPNCTDYYRSGFDRGHLAPSGDFNYDRFAQLSTFVLTNMAPQYHPFNAGLWLVAENKVREWALQYSTIFVISGCVLGDGRRDPDGNYNWWIGGYEHVAVPTHFYKILSRCNATNITTFSKCPVDNLLTMTFLFKHVNSGVPSDDSTRYLLDSLTTIRNIEMLTGVNFFSHLTVEQQDKIELTKAPALWAT